MQLFITYNKLIGITFKPFMWPLSSTIKCRTLINVMKPPSSSRFIPLLSSLHVPARQTLLPSPTALGSFSPGEQTAARTILGVVAGISFSDRRLAPPALPFPVSHPCSSQFMLVFKGPRSRGQDVHEFLSSCGCQQSFSGYFCYVFRQVLLPPATLAMVAGGGVLIVCLMMSDILCLND